MKKMLIVVLISMALALICEGLCYKKENINTKNTIATVILRNNKIVTTGKGLYKKNKEYYFKGETNNNYLKIFNRLYRIISIKNSKVKVISNKNEAVFFYGNDNNYLNSNIYNWLNKTENKESGIYYNSIKDVENNIIQQKYKNKALYFTILTKEEYIKAGAKQSFLNNGTSSYILDKNIIVKDEKGNIKKNNINNTSGIKVVFTLNKNLIISKGKGTLKNPYLIKEKEKNDINKYVKLGDDTYQIFEEKDNLYKLNLNIHLKEKQAFSSSLSGYNLLNKNNIAYYLNNSYYNKLPYKSYLKNCTFLTGSIEDKSYFSVYKSKVTAKVGLLNMYDLNITNSLNDYYLINTSNKDKNISYVYDKFGSIKEEKSSTLKKIVPVICISKNDIKNGTGTLKNPFIVE